MTAKEIAMSSSIRDFAAPRSSRNLTNLWQEHQPAISHSYVLIQESQDRQILAPIPQKTGPSYQIRFHDLNGAIFRKPRMVITKEHEGRNTSVVSTNSRRSRRRSSIFSSEKENGKTEVATVGIDIQGRMIEIVYRGKSYAQTLSLSDPSTQAYTCIIDGSEHQWRPLGPSRTVIELVGDQEQRVALFLFAGDNLLGSDEGVRRRVSLGVRHNVGELHTVLSADEETRVHEEVLCSALAVVESRRFS